MRIYMTEGFSGEAVRVTVNGNVVLELPRVRTNWSAGLAASGSAEIQPGSTVVVVIPSRALSAQHQVQGRPNTALVVSLGQDGLTVSELPEPVRFM